MLAISRSNTARQDAFNFQIYGRNCSSKYPLTKKRVCLVRLVRSVAASSRLRPRRAPGAGKVGVVQEAPAQLSGWHITMDGHVALACASKDKGRPAARGVWPPNVWLAAGAAKPRCRPVSAVAASASCLFGKH
jgi:hypothetical protein